jgi:hypothetical protein
MFDREFSNPSQHKTNWLFHALFIIPFWVIIPIIIIYIEAYGLWDLFEDVIVIYFIVIGIVTVFYLSYPAIKMRFRKISKGYESTIYKFHKPTLHTNQDFLRIKLLKKNEYLRNCKDEIKHDKRVFLRHHRLGLTAFIICIILIPCIILLSFLSISLKFNPVIEIKPDNTILFLELAVSVITFFILLLSGFPQSLLSFKRYLKDKYNYYCSLKNSVDDCKDYNCYREKYVK